MTNREKLKTAIKEDINPQKYYHEIEKRIDKKRKYSFWKLALVPVLLIFIVSGVWLLKENPHRNNAVILHINELSTTTELPKFQWDEKKLLDHYFNIPYPYKIGNSIAIPADFNQNYYYIAYPEEKKDTQKEDYSVFYYLMVSTNGKDRFIWVAYSQDWNPFGEVFSSGEGKSTFLYGVELKIYQLENDYFVVFDDQRYHFGIETSHITEQELSEFLISILK